MLPSSPDPCLKLEDGVTGAWMVYTATARHLIDLDARLVTRYPADNPAGDGFIVADLRSDGDPISLLGMMTCEVGKPMLMLIQLLDDVITVRTSTPVLHMCRLADHGDEPTIHA